MPEAPSSFESFESQSLRTARERRAAVTDPVLDASQAAAVALPVGRPLLVLGEAGHGKTTVLLHRVARLHRALDRPRTAVLVPNEGLCLSMQPMLRRLGVDVAPWTFDAFATKQARRAFRRLPRESDGAPPAVSRVKRSAAVASALDVLAPRTPGLVDDDVDRARSSRARVSRGDLQHLFGDRVLVERIVREAGLSEHAVHAVLERTRVQFSLRTEEAWSHVTDRQRLLTVDRRAIDAGTSEAAAGTIDVEDYAVLFELDRRRAALAGVDAVRLYRFDVLAIDEAQELGPWELAMLARCLRPGGSLVVAGDAEQHTDETSSFGGWPEAMRALGAADHEVAILPLGYRCAPAIVALARAVRGGHRITPSPVMRFADEGALVASLGAWLAAIARRDPRASVGVVCRGPAMARRLASALAPFAPVRLVFDGRFLPRGPAQITTTSEVKGLELDYVVVPDARASVFPDDAASRRALYVAITRARHRVAVACVGEPTPILA